MEGARALSVSGSYHSPTSVAMSDEFYLNLLCYHNIEGLLNLSSDFFPIDRIGEITVERYVTASGDWYSFQVFDNIDQVLPHVIVVILVGLYIDAQKFIRRY